MAKHEGLNHLVFDTMEALEKWANSKNGTEYIISICKDNDKWVIWYIFE